jgi:hypothetical protein
MPSTNQEENYRVIIVCDNYCLSLPVSLLITFKQPIQLTAHTCGGTAVGSNKLSNKIRTPHTRSGFVMAVKTHILFTHAKDKYFFPIYQLGCLGSPYIHAQKLHMFCIGIFLKNAHCDEG